MNKKMIGAIIAGVLVCIYFFFIFSVAIVSSYFSIFSLVATIVLGGSITLTIYMVKERIDEIQSGEEDDLDKY